MDATVYQLTVKSVEGVEANTMWSVNLFPYFPLLSLSVLMSVWTWGHASISSKVT